MTKKLRNRASQDTTLINQRAMDRRVVALERQMKTLLAGATAAARIKPMSRKR